MQGEVGTGADRDRFWVLLFGLYFLFQAVWRRLIGGALGLDEAQIMLDAQRLAWGYGPQPPLYGWLQWAVFQVIPDPILALALLKNALLAGTFLAVYRLLRSAHPPRVAGLAAASLLLVPQIGWESQRALTHSVLVTTMAAVAALVFWTRVLPRRPGAELVFGVVVALGLLSKVNFVFVPVALGLAAASLPELRARLRPWGLAVSLGVVVAICLWPMIWALQHPEVAFASARKLRRDVDLSLVAGATRGLASFVSAVVGFGILPAVVLGFFRWRNGRPGRVPAPALLDRFLLRAVLIGLAIAFLAILVSGSTQAKDRWLQPVLFLAAPVATLWLLPRITAAGALGLGRVVGALAVVVVAVLPFALVIGTPGDPARGGAPIVALAEAIEAEFPEPGRIIVDPEWLAGNLLLLRPDWHVSRAELARVAPGETVLFLVMKDKETPNELAAEIAARTGVAVQRGESRRFSMAYPLEPGHRLIVDMGPLTAVAP